jgi:hypothetical protein
MADFTVRVELHQGTWTDYETLHAAMEQKGFSRVITASDGRTYQLPLAEYNGSSGTLNCAQIRDIARAAAATTGKGNGVLVSESVSRAWVGLAQTN